MQFKETRVKSCCWVFYEISNYSVVSGVNVYSLWPNRFGFTSGLCFIAQLNKSFGFFKLFLMILHNILFFLIDIFMTLTVGIFINSECCVTILLGFV